MSAGRFLLAALLAMSAASAWAHRVDEYLQATTIAVTPDRIELEIRLVPGVDVFAAVFAMIDRDADGVVSAAEQRAYADRVLGDLDLELDGAPLALRLAGSSVAARELLESGLGEIRLRFEAAVAAPAPTRRLTFDNRHERSMGVYLVNALVPRDERIRLGDQQRTSDQSSYRLEYSDTGSAAAVQPRGGAILRGWRDGMLLALLIGAVALAVRRAQRP